MKKLHYTLIELLAAMTIFIMMMGILFRTFSSGADVAATETVKLSILSDSNIFFNYLTNDIRNINMQSIQRLRDNKNDAIDPDHGTASQEADGKKLHFTDERISFFSTVRAYHDTDGSNYNGVNLVDELDSATKDGIADLDPYVAYELVGDKLVRKMYSTQAAYVDDNNTYADLTTVAELDNESLAVPVILEGVEEFEVTVWSDYPGGTQVDTSQSPLSEKPACITFTITLTDPNPYKNATLKARDNRSISKTIYIGR